MPFLLAAGQNIPVQRGSVVSFPISYSQTCVASTGASPSHNDFLGTVLHAVGVDVMSVGSTSGVDVVNSNAPVTLNKGLLTDLLTTST